MAGKLAIGLAVTAGAVAAGAVLTKKENRTALKKGVRKAAKAVNNARDMLEEGKEKYQTIQHNIGRGRGRKKLDKVIKAAKE